MFLILFLTLLSFSSSTITSTQQLFPFGPITVHQLDLQAFSGRWYQMYGSLIPLETFEKDAYCVTADYKVYDSSQLNIVNSWRDNSPSGNLTSSTGYLKVYNPLEPGNMILIMDNEGPKAVNFWLSTAYIFGGNYHVMNVGPINSSGFYEWAVISTPLKCSLFILARDPTVFINEYETNVLQYVKDKGFTHVLNKPLPIYQSSDCQYAPLPA